MGTNDPVCTKRELISLLQINEEALKELERRAGVYARRSQWYSLWEMTLIKSLWKERRAGSGNKSRNGR